MLYIVFKFLNSSIDKMWKAKINVEQNVNIIDFNNMNKCLANRSWQKTGGRNGYVDVLISSSYTVHSEWILSKNREKD